MTRTRPIMVAAVTFVLALAAGLPAWPATASPATGTQARAGAGTRQLAAAEREQAWATHPETVEAAGYAKRGMAPPGALEAAEKARDDLGQAAPDTELTMRDNIYYAAKSQAGRAHHV